MSTKKREVIFGGRIIGANIRAQQARERAKEAIRAADRARLKHGRSEWRAMAGLRSLRRQIGQCLNVGLGFLEVECNCCRTRVSLPLDAVRRPRDTPIWKLEASLKCRSCPKGRYAPPVHTIKLTETREITPYPWVRPDEER
jgi:hypothetical protein